MNTFHFLAFKILSRSKCLTDIKDPMRSFALIDKNLRFVVCSFQADLWLRPYPFL